MRRSILSLMLALLLALSGCSGQGSVQTEQQINRTPIDLTNVRTTSTVVSYLPGISGLRLIQSSREMVIPEGQQLLQAAIVNLLNEPGDAITMPVFGGGASLKSMVKSMEVLMLDIQTHTKLEDMNERSLLNWVTALVNTIAANSQVKYVFLWINGQALAGRGMLSSPLTRQDTNLEELWIRHQYYMEKGEVNAGDAERQVAFYQDASGKYLLAMVRTDVNTSVSNLIRMMLRAPVDGLTSAIPDTVTTAQTPTVEILEDGTQVVSIWLSGPEYGNISGATLHNMAAALTLSIHCNYPAVDEVKIYMDNRLITSLPDVGLPDVEALTPDMFLHEVADMIELYFPQQQSEKLVKMERATSQESAFMVRNLVDELIRGPLAGENASLTYAFPVGITSEDLLSVEVQGSCAIVNFSENFENYYPEDAVRERLMIYSIVNTLTQDPTIHQVQILVEERRVGAIGSIDLTNPLIRNPGLISIE